MNPHTTTEGASLALTVDELTVTYRDDDAPAVRAVSLSVGRGEIVALVGESGSGKSTFVSAVLGALAEGARVEGRIEVDGGAEPARRARAAGYVPQDPLTSFNPVIRVFPQAVEVARAGGRSARQARDAVREAFARVRLADPDLERRYPHELSGGMRQRALIAIALLNDPRLLLADEPTAALDASVQREIAELLSRIVRADGRGMLLVTHDLALASEHADRIVVLRSGEVVEQGPSREVLTAPRDAYTRELARAAASFVVGAPRAVGPATSASAPLLEVDGVGKRYGRARPALNDVGLTVREGRTLGLVGASGSGKSTLASIVLGATAPSEGSVVWRGRDLTALRGRERRRAFRPIQPVFQDPHASLDPTFTVRRIVAEGARAREGAGPGADVAELLDRVALPASVLDRFPHELSGGQKQRVAIARSLAAEPELLICDEAVSALDVVVQTQIVELLRDVQRERGLAILFISHDLGVVQQIAHDVVVLDHGEVAEHGPVDEVLYAPQSAAARALLSAVPSLRQPEPA